MWQDSRTVQELLRHNDVRTTMIYTHVMEKAAARVRSPLDLVDGSSCGAPGAVGSAQLIANDGAFKPGCQGQSESIRGESR
jgi:hypothetical protein